MSQSQTRYEGIVVLGFPRSGTTLVRRLLNAHPNICCPPETNLLSAAARFLREDGFTGGLTVGVLPGLAFSGLTENEVIGSTREFVFGFFREVARRTGKKIWAEKTAFDSFYIDEIERLCGESCRFICIARHPLDTVCSVKELTDKMETYLPELHRYVRIYPSPLEAFAHAWVDINQRLARFTQEHSENALMLRYEDLTADPEAEVARIFRFLGEHVDANRLIQDALETAGDVGLGDWKTYQTLKVESASVDRWRKLDPSTAANLVVIVGSEMARLGYECPDSQPGRSREKARHLYQLGIMGTRMRAKSSPPEDEDG